LRAVWLPESTRCGDHDGGGQLGAVVDVDGEPVVLTADGSYPVVGADVGVEVLGVAAEVVDDLVAVRVAVRVAGEGHAGQGAVSRWGEQGQAVVVGGPGADWFRTGFEHDRGAACSAECVCGGQAGLPGADDDDVAGVDHEKYCLYWVLGIVRKDSAAAIAARAPRMRKVMV
jgi:hypothetical protein